MFGRVLVVLRAEGDAGRVASFLRDFGFRGEVVLTALDVSGIPVSGHIVSLKTVGWLEAAARYFSDFNVKVRPIKYGGDRHPAEVLEEAAEKEECGWIVLLSKPSAKHLTHNLASTLCAVTHRPLTVIPR